MRCRSGSLVIDSETGFDARSFSGSAPGSNTCTAVREEQDRAEQEVEMHAMQFQQESQRGPSWAGRRQASTLPSPLHPAVIG